MDDEWNFSWIGAQKLNNTISVLLNLISLHNKAMIVMFQELGNPFSDESTSHVQHDTKDVVGESLKIVKVSG